MLVAVISYTVVVLLIRLSIRALIRIVGKSSRNLALTLAEMLPRVIHTAEIARGISSAKKHVDFFFGASQVFRRVRVEK